MYIALSRGNTEEEKSLPCLRTLCTCKIPKLINKQIFYVNYNPAVVFISHYVQV